MDKKIVKIGNVYIGHGYPVAVQSMLNCAPSDFNRSLPQIEELVQAGCEIIRFSVKNEKDVQSISVLKNRTSVPLVADIHFDYQLALASMDQGIDKVRINPGNIGKKSHVDSVVIKAKELNIPIRIGANGGSVKEELISQFKGDIALAMVASTEENLKILEEHDFDNIVVSLKSSDIQTTIKANQIFSQKYPYPIHLGITEASYGTGGIVRSSVGIGSMLLQGIGDTIRVSLTGSPVDEIPVCYEILSAVGIRQRGPYFISCPTCGRCEINLSDLAQKVKEIISDTVKPFKVAVMGCVVNGVGEGKDADIGIAGGNGSGIIFSRGKIIRKVEESKLLEVFREEWEKLKQERE